MAQIEDDRLKALPPSLFTALQCALLTARPWSETSYGRLAHEWFTRSLEVSENYVALFEEMIAKYEQLDESAMLPQFADVRMRHRGDLEVGLAAARRARDAEKHGLELLNRTAG